MLRCVTFKTWDLGAAKFLHGFKETSQTQNRDSGICSRIFAMFIKQIFPAPNWTRIGVPYLVFREESDGAVPGPNPWLKRWKMSKDILNQKTVFLKMKSKNIEKKQYLANVNIEFLQMENMGNTKTMKHMNNMKHEK